MNIPEKYPDIARIAQVAPIEDLEEIRDYLHVIIDGKCVRCGKSLSTTHHRDYVEVRGEGKVCMLCQGGS